MRLQSRVWRLGSVEIDMVAGVHSVASEYDDAKGRQHTVQRLTATVLADASPAIGAELIDPDGLTWRVSRLLDDRGDAPLIELMRVKSATHQTREAVRA